MPEKGVEMKSIKFTFLLFIFLLYGFLNSSTAQWVQMSNGITNGSVYSLVVNGNNIFAGAGSSVPLVYIYLQITAQAGLKLLKIIEMSGH